MWNGKLVLRYIQKMESLEVRTEAQMVTNGRISNPLLIVTAHYRSQVLASARKWFGCKPQVIASRRYRS